MHDTASAPDRIPRLTETQPRIKPSVQRRTNVPEGNAAAAAVEPVATARPELAACAKFLSAATVHVAGPCLV